MSEHTPTPWRVDRTGSIVSESGGYVAEAYDGIKDNDIDLDRCRANAAFIVKTCNEHASLTATVERMRGALENIKRFGELACVQVDHGYTGGKKPASKDVWQFPRHMLVEIDAALSPPPSGEG